MTPLALHEFHQSLNARFIDFNGQEAVEHYGDPLAEHAALRQSAALLDLSFRGRLCLTGADCLQFLNGQVSNQVKTLKAGQGCYATLLTPKGKMESDLNIYLLENEILLDFEPGLSAAVSQRLEKFIIADDVQVVDVTPLYGLLSMQGPKSAAVLESLRLPVPPVAMSTANLDTPQWGEVYSAHLPRAGTGGFDLFVPVAALASVAQELAAAVDKIGGRPCGWQALELARIEAGIPRFGADMDATNLPPEAHLQDRAISYKKGCYVGQEIISRLRTHGRVAKSLAGLRLAESLTNLPGKGDKIFHNGKEVGYITSAVFSPTLKAPIALGYLRREADQIGTELKIQSGQEQIAGSVVALPFTQCL